LSLLLSVLMIAGWNFAGRLSAQDNPAELPEFDPTGFTRIFDGQTLEGWDGDPTYWAVKDGKLVGTVTPETLLSKNSWIVWRGGLVEDFELVLDYRVSAQGNSGVGYRLAVLADDPFSVRGPQADIHGANMFTGICYEENGRRLLAARGQSTWIDPGTEPRLIAQRADPEELQGIVRKEDWNRYRLVVRGHDAQHYLNGYLMSEVHDHDEPNCMKAGLLGVQVHVGPPMTIEYRDIFLKHLGAAPEGPADRSSVTYRSGTLLEREHPPTFENLVRQTARMTAAAATRPIDGKAELTVTTRNLGIVRHDLTDVKLYGESRPMSQVQEFDLVVISGNETIRVPGAGRLLIGKPLDREYRVELKWNANSGAYEIVSLTPIQPAADSKAIVPFAIAVNELLEFRDIRIRELSSATESQPSAGSVRGNAGRRTTREIRAANAKLGRGINLGNALEAPWEGAWGVRLKAEYFTAIKKAGFATVRLPVRWSAHAGTDAPYTIEPKFAERVDWAVGQALANDLNIIVNIHHYDELGTTPDEHLPRLESLWRQIAARYQDRPDGVYFELLNEPHDQLTEAKWNAIVPRLLAAVRETNPMRPVLIGPGQWNSIRALDQLELPQGDRNLIVTIHFYEPFEFTHQGAEWVNGSDQWKGRTWAGTDIEKAAIRSQLEKAAAWATAHDRPVFLGEFGAYEEADLESRARWTRFVAREAEQLGFSWAYWEFGSGFGAYDPHAETWREALKSALLP
jgi:endoglucanase